MNGAFYVGAIGLQAQQRALDVISNNIANINTPAFKRSDVRFSSMLATRGDPDNPPATLQAPFAASGVTATAMPTMDEIGEIATTGRPMDIAIGGRGFVELMGANGQTLLWRGGALKVREDGLLAAADSGLALKASISLPSDAVSIQVDPDGTVRALTSSDAAPVEIGQIDLVSVDDGNGLSPLGGGLYQAADDGKLKSARPGEDGLGGIVQGSIERSNVELTTEMVQLMLIQRSYSANAQMVQAADQLMAIANGLRR